MTGTAALPFLLQRSSDVIGAGALTSTEETVHGLLRLDADRLVVQWRVARRVDRVGPEIRTDRELEPVREVAIPLAGLAAASVRSSWWRLGRKVRLVLTAADLRVFEALAGEGGLRLSHPAELVVEVRPVDRHAAEEFAGDLELALAEGALREAEGPTSSATIARTTEGPRQVRGDVGPAGAT